MYKLELQWKEFNIDLEALNTQLKASYAPNYLGNQAHSVLELWFSEEPDQEVKDEINALWASIDSDQHSIALSYKSVAQIKSEKDAQKASAKAKLEALGLTEAELKALLG